MKELSTPRRSVTGKEFISTHETESFIENKMLALNDGLGPRWMVWKRKRYIILMLTFIGEVFKEVLVTNFTVAVLAMSENYTMTDEKGTTVYTQDFDWDVKTRGFLLSVFYYGYVSTNLLGGILAIRYGGTKLYGLGIGITSVTTLLTPAAAYIHFYLLVALRIFEGMCEGTLRSSIEIIFAKWFPLEERSSLVGIVNSGSSIGILCGLAVSSAISYHWGWPAVFYFTGSIGIAWYIVWLVVARDNPAVDKRISSTELAYIQQPLEISAQRKTQLSSVPYHKILTSVPILALACSFIPGTVCFIMFSSQLPAYIKDVLKLDTESSGYFSSLPFIAKVLAMYSISPVADCLINRKILSTTVVRKIYICGGLTIMAILCFVIQIATTTLSVMCCLIFINICTGCACVQIVVNMLDLAPKYSSILSGGIYTIVLLCGMSVPTVVGYLTQNKTAEEWHTVFSILAGVCMLGATVYGIFGSGQLQSWATEKNKATLDPML